MQAWALYNLLKDYDISVIDYEQDVYRDKYCLFSSAKRWKHNINRLLNCIAIKRQIKGFAEFRSEYLPLMQKCTSSDLSENTFAKYDAIITGSDQIWNVRAEDADDALFFCRIVSVKKMAYACSINNREKV